MESSKSLSSRELSYPVRYAVIGANYKSVPVEQREHLANFGNDIEEILQRVRNECGLKEAALISTCNRFEIISVVNPEESQGLSPVMRIKEMLRTVIGSAFNSDQLYFLENEAAIRHVFRVASSLDSMVLGEPQIVGQVKESYQRAVESGSVGKYLHHLFQFAFSLAKKVRSNTEIAERGVSISYVAVRLAEQIFGDLTKASIMIVGSGTMAELTGLHLQTRGCNKIVVANRTIAHAFDLARRLNGSAIALGDIERHLSDIDVVISSVANLDRPLIEAATLRKVSRKKPLFLVDLGVPRNFLLHFENIDNVYLYNIDDLSAIADENRSIREEAAKEGELIIDHGLYRFERWLMKVAAEPSIIDFRARIMAICEDELGKSLRGRLGEDEQGEISKISRRLSQRMAHDVTKLLATLPGGELSREQVLRIVFEEYLKNL